MKGECYKKLKISFLGKYTHKYNVGGRTNYFSTFISFKIVTQKVEDYFISLLGYNGYYNIFKKAI